MNDQILWFATRGAGIVLLLLFTAVTCLGILTVMRWQSASWPRFLSAELHRNLALLSVVFLVIHVVTAILDPFVSIGWLSIVVPLASDYRPVWVGLGALSVDLFIAIVVTSLLRARFGQRVWRAVHWLAYASWPLAVLHSLGTGYGLGLLVAAPDRPRLRLRRRRGRPVARHLGPLEPQPARGRRRRSRHDEGRLT